MYKKIILSLFFIFGVNSKSVFAVSEGDSLALIALYDSTDGDNWANNTNWKTDPVSTWFGVVVFEDRVTRLQLFNNQLTGSIPPEIGNLSNLTLLELYENQLTGSIPPEIGNLTNLRESYLDQNQLTGSIPPEIGNLTILTKLSLHQNQLTGSIPPEIGNLSNLTHLWIYENQLTGSIPPEIGNLTNLTLLYLHHNQLTGSIPPEIGNLTNLTELYLHQNYQLTGSIPPEIGNLTNLAVLDLYFNQLTGSIPPEIGNLTNLTELYLHHNQLTGSIPPEIGNLTNLTVLYLSINQLTGSIPPEIGNLTNLTFLDLHLNQLTGSIPPEIGNLTNLTGLSLVSNQLTGSIPPEIGNLTILTSLYINNNDLVDLPSLSGLSSLGYLRIENNKFTFEDIEPNIDIPDNEFIYSPQDSVGETQDTTIILDSSFTISVSVGGASNQYQWKKDGSAIAGATGSLYTIDPVEMDDSGSYTCEINNAVATELTLYSRPINVTVTVIVPYITVTSPNGGEDWHIGSSHDITWTSSGTSGSVQIEYSTNNGSSWTEEISSTPDDGSYSWTIPDMPSDNCLMRINDTDGSPSDTSDAVFAISTVPSYITVTSPNGGENWKVDSTYDITWTSSGTSGSVRIGYSTNNGSSWAEEAASTSDDGSYSWMLPDTPSDSCLVRINDTDGSPSDNSDTLFTISPASAVPLAKLPEVYSMSVKRITADKHFELRYTLPEKANVRFSVYDIIGKIVREFSEEKQPGFYSRKIDMCGEPTGVYFIKMEANGKRFTETRKVLLVG